MHPLMIALAVALIVMTIAEFAAIVIYFAHERPQFMHPLLLLICALMIILALSEFMMVIASFVFGLD